MFFKKKKIIPIQYPIYELDCTKYNGFFCSSKERWELQKKNKIEIKDKIEIER